MELENQVKSAMGAIKQKETPQKFLIWRYLKGNDIGVRTLQKCLALVGKTLKVVEKDEA